MVSSLPPTRVSDVCCLCDEQSERCHVIESWAGKWHSACSHCVCELCLCEWIFDKLPQCRERGVLRVGCPHPACTKALPQKLVFAMSRAASVLAEEIDMSMDICAADDGSDVSDADAQLDASSNKLKIPSEKCPICWTGLGVVEPGLWDERHDDCKAHQSMCRDVCWRCTLTWITANLEECKRQRRVTVRCLGMGCDLTLPFSVMRGVCPQSQSLLRDLVFLSTLQGNPDYPPERQVNCPREGCIGIGYLGFEKVMCFLCQEQWDAPDFAESVVNEDMDFICEGSGMRIKKCPKCSIPIEKNGGCDHMHCVRCGIDFWWTSLKLWDRREN